MLKINESPASIRTGPSSWHGKTVYLRWVPPVSWNSNTASLINPADFFSLAWPNADQRSINLWELGQAGQPDSPGLHHWSPCASMCVHTRVYMHDHDLERRKKLVSPSSPACCFKSFFNRCCLFTLTETFDLNASQRQAFGKERPVNKWLRVGWLFRSVWWLLMLSVPHFQLKYSWHWLNVAVRYGVMLAWSHCIRWGINMFTRRFWT